jgi:hypothetical protein
MISGAYLDKIVYRCKQMKIGEIVPIKKGHPNYEEFVVTVKKMIDWELDLDNGFVIEFSNDYTSIRKKEKPKYD